MKKISVIILFFISMLCFGQLAGRKNFDIMAGYEANGLFGRIAYSYFHKTDHFIRIAGQFHIENFDSSKNEVPVQLYVGSLEYNRGIWYSSSEDLTFYLGAGLLGGYESVNNGKSFLDDGRKVIAESQFIYGATIGAEMDWYIADITGRNRDRRDLLLFVNTKLNYYANSDVGDIQPNLGAGIRIGF